ncbi:MAG TPA: 5-formyltetrahydrofolate cyclo-ligase [Gallionella sp.]|nr:5-formyltetrahydrofolate cyclo-ligase [Gallionella sp.]
MSASVTSVKQTLRKNIIELRKQLPMEVRSARSAAITERLLQLPAFQQADAVLGYMNFGAEFFSELWIAEALAQGKRVALPKVNHHTNHLDLYWVEDLENQLETGLWNIREPIVERCERVLALNEVEFALLPGVAFTRAGARLGYGGGFYDKLLAQLDQDNAGVPRPQLVAAAFALQLVDQLPQEATDIKVEWVVTEHETIACSDQSVPIG